MNYIIILAGAASVFLTAVPNYVHPISKAEEPRYENLINLAVKQQKNKFVQIPENPVSYDELRDMALYNCKNNTNPDPEIIDMLIEVERSFNPPTKMRGMLLSAACSESGYNSKAEGDRKFSKYKKQDKVWLAAWVTGIRYKKVGGRCKERPLHYRVLKRWHRHIYENRQVESECEPTYDGCGC